MCWWDVVHTHTHVPTQSVDPIFLKGGPGTGECEDWVARGEGVGLHGHQAEGGARGKGENIG